MTGWTRERVLDAFADWVWVPDGAQVVAPGDYHLTAFPPEFNVPTNVGWCRSSRPAAEVVDEVVGHVRGWDRDEVSFWVGERTLPLDLEEEVLRRGAEHAETVELLALPLDRLPAPDLPPLVSVAQVSDARTRLDANLVAEEVWGDAGGDTREEDQEPVPGELRVVGYVDGQPACAAGCTVVGEVARLWGGATREHLRGRGAYRAVLLERLRIARERGATVGLVKAVDTTSAPILRRLGFEGHGSQQRYRLPLA